MTGRIVGVGLGLGVLCAAAIALAQPYRYVDDQGVVHYTDRIEAVPEKYRSQFASPPPPRPPAPQSVPPAAPPRQTTSDIDAAGEQLNAVRTRLPPPESPAVKAPEPAARAPKPVTIDRRLLESVAISPLPAQTPPAFTLKSVDGKNVSLSDYRGRPMILYFWATW